MAKVAHLITGLGTGGAEAMLYKLLSSSSGSERAFVVSLTSGGKHRALLEGLGVQVFELDLRRFWMLPIRLFQVLRLIRVHDVQLVHAWMYHAALFSCFLKCLSFWRSTAYVWNIRHSLHSLSEEKTSLKLVILTLGLCGCLPDKVIFNSRKSAAEHQRFWRIGKKVVFIPNGFELEKWVPIDVVSPDKKAYARQQLGVEGGFVIGHVGRVHPMKNQQGLLEAFFSISRQFPNVHLVLIGKGTESLLLSNERTGSDRVHCLGERSDIYQLLIALDAFVLSSNWGEGFPNVLGEAMACGLPCVTTDVGDSGYLLGMPEYVIPAYNQNALTQAIVTLVELNESTRSSLGLALRRRVEKNFSISAIQSAYQRLHDDTTYHKSAANKGSM